MYLWFQITMDNILSMHIGDSRCDFTHDVAGFFLAQSALLDDVIEQLAAFHQLHHHVDAICTLIGIF